MNFVQFEFLVFFTIVFVLYWGLPRRRVQNVVLLIASFIFYGWVQPWFVLLLFGSATIDYLVARGMGKYRSHRKKFMALSLMGNLGALCWFKYFDFFILNVAEALDMLGVASQPRTLGIYLPLGISFYTFQTLSYTIDVYRGILKPRESYLDYLAFVTLFPQLVAGPIERAARLLPQVERVRTFEWKRTLSGLELAAFGAFKKIVIADTLAPFVDQAFLVRDPAGVVIWSGAFVFGIQVWGDLSGYTDMARGTARMLGFELAKNFDDPHKAASTPEFWRRWHMSVSTWFRDYVSVPLLAATPNPSFFRLAWAIFLTFMIIGVWHGAGWNYAAFGLYHVLWVLFYLVVGPKVPKRFQQNRFLRYLAIQFHILIVLPPGALIFREPSFVRAMGLITTPPWTGTVDDWVVGVAMLCITGMLLIPMGIQRSVETHLAPRLKRRPTAWLYMRAMGWTFCVVSSVVFYRENARDFIYFQF